jgi:hypothetical protein
MSRLRRIVTLGCALTTVSGAAAAQPIDTAGASSCAVRGYARDTDPKGTNIRSAPRPDAPIIGRVAPLEKIGDDIWTGVEFDIVGARDGWLLIRNGDPGGLTFDAAHQADGRGWVSARLVGTALRVRAFRSQPHRGAPEVAQMAGDNWGPDSAKVSVVHGCQGDYIDVTATPFGGKPVRGWSYKPCSSQLTTCDGGIME